MANFKRRKSKRQVRCTLCTADRWRGNRAGRFKAKDEIGKKCGKKQIEAFYKGGTDG